MAARYRSRQPYSAPPPAPYAAAKLASEALAAAYHGCYGLPYLVFRFSNV